MTRTEDSLLKLKRNRKSAVPATAGVMSDDNKIRLQLALDIEEYSIQVHVNPPSLRYFFMAERVRYSFKQATKIRAVIALVVGLDRVSVYFTPKAWYVQSSGQCVCVCVCVCGSSGL